MTREAVSKAAVNASATVKLCIQECLTFPHLNVYSLA